MSPIDQALSILAATAWAVGEDNYPRTRRLDRILKRAIATLKTYQARKGAVA